MKFTRPLAIVGIFGAVSFASAAPAAAALELCNKTSYIVYAAIGWATKAELDAQGWTRVVPGECAAPIAKALSAPAYFIYAHTSRAHSGPSRAWGGNVEICARDTNFSQRTKLPVHGCANGFYKMPFAVLDRRKRASWTTTFTESPPLGSLQAAQRVGINRLLTDLGYHVNGPGDRARDLAIEDFRRRMKLPVNATGGELFAALETEAMKAAAPAGYTACNDTDEQIWTAVGLETRKGVSTRGWWQIPSGACARLIAKPLKTARVYLLVRGKGKRAIVSGPVKLCVKDVQFEIAGKPPCKGKGAVEMGFASTGVKGRTGYAAEIGDDGLLPAAPPFRRTAAEK